MDKMLRWFWTDDFQIYLPGPQSDINEIFSQVNQDLDSICSWASSNGLVINFKKTQAIYFSAQKIPQFPRLVFDSNPVPLSVKVTNLGMVFDRTLNWDLHVNSIVSTIFFKLRKLYQIKNLLPQEARLRLVRALILHHLYYGDVVFFNAPKSCFKKLEKAINACTRFVFNIPGRTSPGRFRNVILGRSIQNHFKYRSLYFFFEAAQVQRTWLSIRLIALLPRFTRPRCLMWGVLFWLNK
jgi:hypothetical protein